MRVLLDESIPHDLAVELRGHDVETVTGCGWAGLANGELLRRAASAFNVFVTMARNVPYQQNLPVAGIGVVLLRAHSNRMAHLRPLVPQILEAFDGIRPGELCRVGA